MKRFTLTDTTTGTRRYVRGTNALRTAIEDSFSYGMADAVRRSIDAVMRCATETLEVGEDMGQHYAAQELFINVKYTGDTGYTAEEYAAAQAQSYKLNMAAYNGETVTQGHADYCATNGHADNHGRAAYCHRCGQVTTNTEPAPIVSEVEDAAEYTQQAIYDAEDAAAAQQVTVTDAANVKPGAKLTGYTGADPVTGISAVTPVDSSHVELTYTTASGRSFTETLPNTYPIYVATPEHLSPAACYVCGGRAGFSHRDEDHTYTSIAQAEAAATAADRHTTNAPEAAYVAEHRPY